MVAKKLEKVKQEKREKLTKIGDIIDRVVSLFLKLNLKMVVTNIFYSNFIIT